MERLEKAILCKLHSINGLGSGYLWKIKAEFGSFRNCFECDSKALYKSFLPAALVDEIIKLRKDDPINYLESIFLQQVDIVTAEDEEYPVMLRNIANPPYLLYCKGKLEILKDFCLAVVGARKSTPYGRNTARRFAEELSKEGITIVSGMARGIDTEAHVGALDAGGYTIAVLGSGLNYVYPKENLNLYNRIAQNGLIISEFSLYTHPEPRNFPMRNRIIAGLSKGVIIVEARSKSGALITADFALEQGRDVFAVPGPITSITSEGCNNLIKQGAKLISQVDDILEEYYDICTAKAEKKYEQEELLLLDSNENLIIKCMGYEECHFNDLLTNTKLEIGVLSTLLLNLEFKGLIKSLPGKYYVKI